MCCTEMFIQCYCGNIMINSDFVLSSHLIAYLIKHLKSNVNLNKGINKEKLKWTCLRNESILKMYKLNDKMNKLKI